MSRRKRQRQRSYAGIPGDSALPFLIGGVALMFLAFRDRISNAVVSAMRTPQSILDAVAEIDPEHDPEMQPGWWPEPPGYKAGITWCSKFCARVTARLGCPILYSQYGARANDQIRWLESGVVPAGMSFGSNAGWRQLSRDDAQLAAIRGEVVLATYKNPNDALSGHIALVLPLDGPMQIAQAGGFNRNQIPIAQGFGTLPTVFFAHA